MKSPWKGSRYCLADISTRLLPSTPQGKLAKALHTAFEEAQLSAAISSTSIGSSDDNSGSSTGTVCPHRFLELWNGVNWHCGACKVEVKDALRLDKEEEHLERVIAEDDEAFGNSESAGRRDRAGQSNYGRGVSLRWLIRFATEHDCWEWPTWRITMDIVRVATEHRGRCRYVDLPEMRQAGVVGNADFFVSHCWGARFGDLVGALAQLCAGSDPFVWIDNFAVRQESTTRERIRRRRPER